MDVVGELPDSEAFHTILVVIDRFTKVQHYIPAMTTWTAEDIAASYINDLWKLYVPPGHVTSDRGPQFASKFLKELNRKLNINLRLSTAYHPQTDGLRERAVQILKQYLRIYCHDRQNRWRAWLPLAEFAYYTTATATQKLCPHRSLCGFDPRTIPLDKDYELSSPAAEQWLHRMTTVHNHIHGVLRRINHKQSTLHVEKARQFNIEDWVLVDRRNLQVKAGNNKLLTRKWLRPYEVIKAIGSHAYRLEVPEGTRWHNVVHTTFLKPFRRRNEPQDMDEDEEEIWEVEEIVLLRRVKGVVQHRVRWTGCIELEDTWETFEHLDNCLEKLQAFRQKFHRKPRDERDV